jgi:hypothetical protein
LNVQQTKNPYNIISLNKICFMSNPIHDTKKNSYNKIRTFFHHKQMWHSNNLFGSYHALHSNITNKICKWSNEDS